MRRLVFKFRLAIRPYGVAELMRCFTGAPIGKVGSVSYPTSVEVVSRNAIPIGTYVAIPFKAVDVTGSSDLSCCAVGVISLTSYRRALPVSPTAMSIESIGIEDDMLRYSPSIARVIALVCEENGRSSIRIPNIPPPPDSKVYLASSEILSELFSCRSDSSIRIGHLMTKPDVEIYVDINALVKHLFITGTTGSGKSNTVAVLADRIASYGGAVVIYDVHGEYSSLSVTEGVVLKPIEYKINPLEIPPKVLARMIIPEGGATVQRMLTSKALKDAQKIFKELRDRYGLNEKAIENFSAVAKEVLRYSLPVDHAVKEVLSAHEEEGVADINTVLVNLFKETAKSIIMSRVGASEKDSKDSANKACAKIDEFFENAAISFETPSVVSLLAPSTIVVLNVSLLSDEQKDYVLKVVLDELLWVSKRNYLLNKPLPVLVFIEEAHLFLSTNRTTVSKYSIERVAREGRKFGLSLGVISQRPRNIDMNTLSQIQNFVFMKLVQEADQQAVMNASDMLTEDLARSLASMGTGEALILGEWVGRFPVFVKIDKHEGKRMGSSLDIAGIWRSSKRASVHAEEMASIVSGASKDFEELFS